MNIFERIIQDYLFKDIWVHLKSFLFNEKRWNQLISLKPIEIYSTTTDLEIDGAKVDLKIKGELENIVEKRISNVKNLLSFNFLDWTNNQANYKFKIIIKAKADYQNVSHFFNHHFANIKYDIEPNQYSILIKEFIVSSNNTKALVEVPFIIYTNKWYLKKQYEGKAYFSGSILFNNPAHTIKTRNLSYTLDSNSLIIKWVDRIYHKDIIDFLNTFLVYNFKEELFFAKLQAQQQLDSFQVDKDWIQGSILNLDLERITIDRDALHGVFVANGNLEVSRNKLLF